MTTPGPRAGWCRGAIAAAAVTIACTGLAAMICPQAHPAATQAMTTATIAVNCPPPSAPASQDGQPGC